jgi:hypothetical protein
MKNWFKALMARLAGTNRTRTPGRTDWRGRPVGENEGEAMPPAGVTGVDPYATLLPLTANKHRQTPDLDSPGEREGSP